ncbi:MAG TPA: citrate synthase [Acidobacteriota bacterium]|nr:citrate synthase [Acidobacteriota bacterium]HNB73346.1 citrate synthase [Acidobacteriota bacterium]
MAEPTKGLQDIVAADSTICLITPDGRLAYRGLDIEDLAEHSTFEETVFFLLYGHLPKQAELDDFKVKLAEGRKLPAEIITLMKDFPKTAFPMEALRTATSALSFYDPDTHDNSYEASVRKAIRLIGQLTLLTTGFDRIRRGLEPIEPDPSMSMAEAFLYSLHGEKPSASGARAFDVCLILHADHELNASTFAARVIASTLSDVHAAITGGIGALAGPLHGGANQRVLEMLLDIGELDRVEAYVDDIFTNKKKIMGFGHRVYRATDPRANIFRVFSKNLGEETGEPKWFQMCEMIEKMVFEKKKLYPNVDFFSGTVLHALKIPTDLFTPVFACSRVSGWSAHVLEQLNNNRLIRPVADYQGAIKMEYTPIDQR